MEKGTTLKQFQVLEILLVVKHKQKSFIIEEKILENRQSKHSLANMNYVLVKY